MLGFSDTTVAMSFAAEILVKGALLLAGVLVLTYLGGRRRSAWRRLVLHTGTVALLILPIAVAVLPSVNLGLMPIQAPDILMAVDLPTARVPAIAYPSPHFGSALSSIDLWHLGLVLYAVGAAGLLLQLACALVQIGAMRRRSTGITETSIQHRWRWWKWRMGVRRDLSLVTNPELRAPTQIGVLDPVVALPDAVVQKTGAPVQDRVLIHELAHIRGHDSLFRMLSLVARAMYWPVPLGWLVCRQLIDAQEQVCDDWVVGLTGDPRQYAVSLLDLAKQAQVRPTLLPALEMVRMPRVVARAERVVAIGPDASAQLGRAATLVTGSALICIGGLIGSLSLTNGFPHPAPVPSAPEASGSRKMLRENTPESAAAEPWQARIRVGAPRAGIPPKGDTPPETSRADGLTEIGALAEMSPPDVAVYRFSRRRPGYVPAVPQRVLVLKLRQGQGTATQVGGPSAGDVDRHRAVYAAWLRSKHSTVAEEEHSGLLAGGMAVQQSRVEPKTNLYRKGWNEQWAVIESRPSGWWIDYRDGRVPDPLNQVAAEWRLRDDIYAKRAR